MPSGRKYPDQIKEKLLHYLDQLREGQKEYSLPVVRKCARLSGDKMTYQVYLLSAQIEYSLWYEQGYTE